MDFGDKLHQPHLPMNDTGTATSLDGRFNPFCRIADFSGHGVSASLNVFRLHALLNALGKRVVDPATTLTRLNKALFDLLPRGQYATIFLGIIDSARQTLTWAAGGAPPPILSLGDGSDQWLDTRGRPLGITAEAKYVNRMAPFPVGSSLFLYSDAMLEARTADGEMLGDDGLLAMVRSYRGDSGIDIARLVEEFTDIAGSPLDDDLTAVSITSIAGAARPRPEPPISTAATALTAMILASPGSDSIAAGLSAPYGGFLEITDAGLSDVGRACFEAAAQGALCLSLSTAAAYDRRMWELLTEAVKQRYPGGRDWDALELILSEAIANAIIHGNLGIRSGLRETLSGLERFAEDIRRHLGEPASAGKRVEATICLMPDGRLQILVSDRGPGFDFARGDDAVRPQNAKHGRGLSLIRKIAHTVTFRDGGRTIVMTL